MVEKRGLGRGLSALLEEQDDGGPTPGAPAPDRTVPIELLRPNPLRPSAIAKSLS